MKNKIFQIWFFLLFACLGFTPSLVHGTDKQLKINIICYRNGVGLNRDIDLLMEELSKLGHRVNFIDCHDSTPRPKADVNVFVDIVIESLFSLAKKNYLIPNPDWCFLSAEQLAQFDKILCKTKEAVRIFKPLNPNTVYMSFTCKDRWNESIPKNYKRPIHLVGASIQKGTDTVIKTWMANPQFPLLLLVRHKGNVYYPPVSNLKLIDEYLLDSELISLQNSCGLHLCTSETEGFGHYIMEALSCGCVVITTDAPPMNEFVSDPRCLVKFSRTAPWRWATNYYVDLTRLEMVVATLLSLPEEELKEIGRKNREFYLKNDRFFKEKLAEIFNADSVFNSQWEMTEFVWNLGIASQCTVGLDPDPKTFFQTYREEKLSKEIFQHVKAGDTAWIRCCDIPKFYKQILPDLDNPLVLVVSDGDESFPSAFAKEIDVEALLSHDKIIHVFAQNCDYRGPSNKVSHLPIGIDFHTIAYRTATYWGETGSPLQQEAVLKAILQELKPTHLRKCRAFVDFQLADSIRYGDCKRYLELGEDRTTIFNRLLATNLIDYADRMKRSDLWRTKGQYAFSISPHGNGLDCHRTWEDLVLGCIVIVKTSSLDPLYEGLPVVIVKDWSEVTEENMRAWLAQYGDAFTNPSYREKLTNRYWISKLRYHLNP